MSMNVSVSVPRVTMLSCGHFLKMAPAQHNDGWVDWTPLPEHIVKMLQKRRLGLLFIGFLSLLVLLT